MRTGIYGNAMGMAMAALALARPPEGRYVNQIGPGTRSPVKGRNIRANLSRRHPDYGLTPAEHEKRKALRAAGKLPFREKKA